MSLRKIESVAVALLAAVVLGCLPASASAIVSPTIAVTQPSGNAAESTGSIGVYITFNQSYTKFGGDAAKDFDLILPPGLMVNEETDGGACLSQTAPTSACEIGSGTAVLGGTSVSTGTPTPMALYLVSAAEAGSPTALAGVELVTSAFTLSGQLSFHSSESSGTLQAFDVSDELSFINLPDAPVEALDFTLNGLTFPSSCQASPVTLVATSQNDATPVYVPSAPFAVTNCFALQYQPQMALDLSRDRASLSAGALITLSDPAGDALTQDVKIRFPASLTLNPHMAPCFEGAVCNIGTFTAQSPLVPAGQLYGTLTLGGTERAPTLGINIPGPADLQLPTSFSDGSLTIVLPEVPMTSISIRLRGNSLGSPLVATCYKSIYSATFYPRTGESPVLSTGQSGVGNCIFPQKPLPVTPPTVTASVAGLSSGAPAVSITASKGSHAPSIRSLSVSLPRGLSFAAGADVAAPSLLLSGAKAASAEVSHGVLVVRFKHASTSARLRLRAPLLAESPSLRHASSRTARSSHIVVTVVDTSGKRTKRSVPIS